MMYRFVFVCFLLRFNIRGEDQIHRVPRKIGGPRYCNFDEVTNNYDASDLLGCIDHLAVDLADRESGRLMNGKGQWFGSTGKQMSIMDIFSSFLNQYPAPSHQGGPLPAKPTSSYQQSNYPSGTAGLSPGSQLNLFQALSTITGHDDYKCVPRILCEMASGKLPGRSLGKQGSGFFELLGRNAFTDWLTKFDVAGVSPVLDLGRAVILGYSNRGNSLACYDAFPKCPKNANGLVYYLNNYKGGFFRLFNRFLGGSYGGYNWVAGRGAEVKGRVVTGNSNNYFANEPVESKIQFPVRQYQQHFGETGFPEQDEIRSNNDFVFPKLEDLYGESTIVGSDNDIQRYTESGSIFREQKDLIIDPATINIQNNVPEPGTYFSQTDDIPFFPRERLGRKLSRIRFPSDFELTSTD